MMGCLDHSIQLRSIQLLVNRMKCPDCDEVCKTSADLKEHYSCLHLAYFPYMCWKCHHFFVDRSALEGHATIANHLPAKNLYRFNQKKEQRLLSVVHLAERCEKNITLDARTDNNVQSSGRVSDQSLNEHKEEKFDLPVASNSTKTDIAGGRTTSRKQPDDENDYIDDSFTPIIAKPEVVGCSVVQQEDLLSTNNLSPGSKKKRQGGHSAITDTERFWSDVDRHWGNDVGQLGRFVARCDDDDSGDDHTAVVTKQSGRKYTHTEAQSTLESEENMECDVCGKRNNCGSSGFIRHLYTHMDKKPYYCAICNTYENYYPAGVIKHITTKHWKMRRFKCTICGVKMSGSDTVRKHIAAKHAQSSSKQGKE